MSILRTVIVGGHFHDGALERSKALLVGERLLLLREPTNPFDKNAVAVMSEDGVKLGYIPRTEAPSVAKAIDAGFEPWAETLRKGLTSINVKWRD